MKSNKCYDGKRGVWMVNNHDGRGWVADTGNASEKIEYRTSPPGLTNQARLLARFADMKQSIGRIFQRVEEGEVLDREKRTARKNTRYLW